MPFPSQSDLATTTPFETPAAIGQDWRSALPRLMGGLASLRELQMTDAPALFAALSNDQVSRFISAPPATVEGFYQFISWAIRKRQAGLCACYAVVPHGSETPVGLFQIRSLDPAFDNAEWGLLGSGMVGQGLFMDAARQVVDFAFAVLRVHSSRRAVLTNTRGVARCASSAVRRAVAAIIRRNGDARPGAVDHLRSDSSEGHLGFTDHSLIPLREPLDRTWSP